MPGGRWLMWGVLCRVRGVGGDHHRCSTLLGRLGVLGDTHAQEGGGPTPTVTPTTLLDEEEDGETKEKREDAPDCTRP